MLASEQLPLRPNFGGGAFRLAADVDRHILMAKLAVLTGRTPSFDDLTEHVFQPIFAHRYGYHHAP